MDIKKLTMKMQYRPRDSADRRMYNPDRDIAYLTPILMQLTTNSFYMAGAARDEFMLEISNRPSLDQAEATAVFGKMCQCMGKDFCQQFMRGEKTFTEALVEAGLRKFPMWMVRLWMAHFGHTVMSAFYYGVRSVMMVGSEEDAMPYEDIFDSSEELQRNLAGETDA